jgi:hypothetical protein
MRCTMGIKCAPGNQFKCWSSYTLAGARQAREEGIQNVWGCGHLSFPRLHSSDQTLPYRAPWDPDG